jgi:hypothetical protein
MDWSPAALDSQRRFVELAGVDPATLKGGGLMNTRAARAPVPENAGDVFFREDGVYFCVNQGARRLYTMPSGETVYIRTDDSSVRLSLGLITPNSDAAEERLKALAEVVEKAVMTSLDGRRTRHMKFGWELSQGGDGKLQGLCKRLEREGATPIFREPDMSAEMMTGAAALVDLAAREFLRELSGAGFARESDVLAQRGRKEEEVKKLLGSLKATGLIRTEYLLQCRKSSAPLTKVASAAQVADAGMSQLTCVGCGRKFSEELLTEGYSVSELGKSLLSGSHWMTVWVTARLQELGVPLSAVMWNLAESGEEVDILVDFLNRLWIIELKDREFGSGDAHPFNYRRVRYRADEAVVITTEKVSGDAKRVFEELAASADRSRPGRAQRAAGEGSPVLVEGLSSVGPRLMKELERASFLLAAGSVRELAQVTGFDISSVIDARYGSGAASSSS